MAEPEFLPGKHFFRKMVESDVWIVLDHATFQNGNNECRIKTPSGMQILHVTIRHPYDKPICQTLIDNFQPWKRDFLKAVEFNYKHTPFFNEYFDTLKYYINGPCVLLEPLLVSTSLWVAEVLGCRIKPVYSCQIKPSFSSTEELTKAVKPTFGEDLVEKDPVLDGNITILDLLFTKGAQETRRVLADRNSF